MSKIYRAKTVELTDALGVYLPVSEDSYELNGPAPIQAGFGSKISGNCGVAGATVSYTGTGSGSVTSDGSGNYLILGLVNGSYVVTPSLAGYVFSPVSLSETVIGFNISGASFTAISNPSVTYNQLAIDQFYRADENPLNPANWTVNSAHGLNPFYPIQIVSNIAEPTTGLGDCMEYWNNGSWPSSGQYCQVEVTSLANSLNGGVFVFCFTSVDEYFSYTAYVFKEADNSASLELDVNQGSNLDFTPIITTLATVTGLTFTGYDILRLEVTPGLQNVYWNSTLVMTAHDSSIPLTGPAALLLSTYNFDNTSAQAINFVAGSITAASNPSPFFGMGLGFG